MRRLHLFFLLAIAAFGVRAQASREAEVRETIDAFFEAYQAKDTLRLSQLTERSGRLQSVGEDPEGKPVVRTMGFEQFLSLVGSMPDTLVFEERLLDYQIRTDANLAHAWTPYHFYMDGSLHHCGVNSFQLYHDGQGWRIIYIVDTRRTERCEP